MKIHTIGIRSNPKPRSKQIAKELKKELSKYHFEFTEDNPDLWIAVGGDGTFLRMVRETGFQKNTIYTGIHTGTLGFLQEIFPNQIPELAKYLASNNVEYEKKDILVTKIHSKQSIDTLYSLNEILIRHGSLKTMKAEVKIDDVFLEKFVGDGLLISTSVGSSAYNISFGGAIVDNDFATIQMTPIAPINSRSYHTLVNSFVFPSKRKIQITPIKPTILCTSDGDNTNHNAVLHIEVSTIHGAIRTLKFSKVDFVSKIHQKFLK